MAIQFKGKTLKKGDTLYRACAVWDRIDEIQMTFVGQKKCEYESIFHPHRGIEKIGTEVLQLHTRYFWTSKDAEQFIAERLKQRKEHLVAEIGSAFNEVVTLMEGMAPAEEQHERNLESILESFRDLVDDYKRAKKKGDKNDDDA